MFKPLWIFQWCGCIVHYFSRVVIPASRISYWPLWDCLWVTISVVAIVSDYERELWENFFIEYEHCCYECLDYQFLYLARYFALCLHEIRHPGRHLGHFDNAHYIYHYFLNIFHSKFTTIYILLRSLPECITNVRINTILQSLYAS